MEVGAIVLRTNHSSLRSLLLLLQTSYRCFGFFLVISACWSLNRIVCTLAQRWRSRSRILLGSGHPMDGSKIVHLPLFMVHVHQRQQCWDLGHLVYLRWMANQSGKYLRLSAFWFNRRRVTTPINQFGREVRNYGFEIHRFWNGHIDGNGVDLLGVREKYNLQFYALQSPCRLIWRECIEIVVKLSSNPQILFHFSFIHFLFKHNSHFPH